MTTTSWMAEFYPINAELAPESEAIKHSLRKWKGLTEKNLQKHGISSPPIEVTDTTCSLCISYKSKCMACPLGQYLGRPCASYHGKYEFEEYIENGNPIPMITALEAIAEVERICK